jgi:PAS domain S-box-containing protein
MKDKTKILEPGKQVQSHQVVSESADSEDGTSNTKDNLHENKLLLDSIINGASEGIFVLDENGCYVLINPACGRIMDYTCDDWIGKQAGSSINTDDIEQSILYFNKALSGEKCSYEGCFATSDGEERILNIKLSSLTYNEKPHVLGVVEDITDRRISEEALKKSEEKWRSLVKNSPNIIIISDREGVIQFVNHTLPGYSEAETIGSSIYEFIHHEYHSIAKQAIERAFETGEFDDYEIVGSGTEEKFSWYYTQIGPVMLNGQVVSAMLIAMDITERKQVEETIKESERNYRILADNVTDVIWTMDMNLTYTYINPSVERLLGYTADEIMAMNLDEIVTPDSFATAIKVFEEELATEEVEDKDLFRIRAFEVEQYCKDGSTVWAEVKAVFLRDPDGNPTGILGITRDITDRKLTEKMLVHAANEWRVTFDSMSDAVMMIDRDQTIIRANKAASTALGLSFQEMLGQKCFECVHGTDSRPEYCLNALTLADGKKHSIEIYEQNLDRYYLITTTPVHDESGKLTSSIHVMSDITEREIEKEARGLAERKLEEQRTQAICSDRLRSLGEMATGIAHELNQPLLGVRGLTEHILIGLDRKWDFSEEKTKDKLKLIIEQADRMSHVIEHVRLFARGAETTDILPVDVNEVINSATSLIDVQSRSRGMKLECELSRDLPLVLANPFSLEEVILNLITNARDALKEKLIIDPAWKSPQIILRSSEDYSNSEKCVKIEVIDQGSGIPPEVLPKIFDPFFTTKSPDEGTGVGLSISKTIIEGFDGQINIQSDVGLGTRVTIVLPAIKHDIGGES